MSPEEFARGEYWEYKLYSELAKSERNAEFKRILNDLTAVELRHHNFWLRLSEKKTFRGPTRPQAFLFKTFRKYFGLTFVLKFMQKQEENAIHQYKVFQSQITDEKVKREIAMIIDDERHHESAIIAQIKEEKVEFIGSIVLGLNDALIELTGALVGFSFALREHLLVSLTGTITGVAAALSMTASAYLQAQFEKGKESRKAALYTGAAYFIVVVILVAPYLLFKNVFVGVAVMLVLVIAVVLVTSYYTSVVFARRFGRQFREMALFSIGIAIITFAIGLLLRRLFSIEI